MSLDHVGDVEHYAPGYLAFERQGHEAEYAPSPLVHSWFGYKWTSAGRYNLITRLVSICLSVDMYDMSISRYEIWYSSLYIEIQICALPFLPNDIYSAISR